MGPERTRVLVRSSGGHRGDVARPPRTRPAAFGDLVARHDLGGTRRPARQPHLEPRRGAVRRRRIGDARAAAAGPAARALRPGRPCQRGGVALPGAQPGVGAEPTRHQARRRSARAAGPEADPTHQGVTGATGRSEAPPERDEAPPAVAARGRGLAQRRCRAATLSAVEDTWETSSPTATGEGCEALEPPVPS